MSAWCSSLVLHVLVLLLPCQARFLTALTDRPLWITDQDKLRGAGRPPSVSRVGEWQLVWKPAKSKQLPLQPVKSVRREDAHSSSGVRRNWGPGSRNATAVTPLRASTRHASKPPFGDGMMGVLTTGLLKTGIPGMTPPTRGAAAMLVRRPASVQGFVRSNSQIEVMTSARSALSTIGPVHPLHLPLRGGPYISTLGSEPANSERSHLSTVSRQSEGISEARRKRLGTGNSLRSQRSVSSLGSSMSGTYSAYSDLTSASQTTDVEILKRIKGLEDALNAERSLRLQMQEMISRKVPAIREIESRK